MWSFNSGFSGVSPLDVVHPCVFPINTSHLRKFTKRYFWSLQEVNYMFIHKFAPLGHQHYLGYCPSTRLFALSKLGRALGRREHCGLENSLLLRFSLLFETQNRDVLMETMICTFTCRLFSYPLSSQRSKPVLGSSLLVSSPTRLLRPGKNSGGCTPSVVQSSPDPFIPLDSRWNRDTHRSLSQVLHGLFPCKLLSASILPFSELHILQVLDTFNTF